ncbi:hypothetical protein ACFFJB_14775 [Camelimonas abortus]|uniref:VRR-NUC domain-containing protein n=1 Tax=Camelimonas abortus TaxID=1017184 RepID=A0ABV7LI17_9HYPH
MIIAKPQRRKRVQRELGPHKAIAAFLDCALPEEYRYTHVPNGGARDARTGAMLKAMGVKAGVPDMVVFGPGSWCGLLEIKPANGGALSPSQKAWAEWAGQNSVCYAVVRSVGDVQVALNDWRIPLRAEVAA